MLKYCKSLAELYLRWNKITQVGARKILEGIITKDQLKVLDFSWNALCLGDKSEKVKPVTDSGHNFFDLLE